MVGVALLLKREQPRQAMALALADQWIHGSAGAGPVPPSPSFSDLASNRPQGLPDPPELAFVLPPEQRNLTEWVRLLRSQPRSRSRCGQPCAHQRLCLEAAARAHP